MKRTEEENEPEESDDLPDTKAAHGLMKCKFTF